MSDQERKVKYKEVELNGKTVIAEKYKGDTHWVVDNDHQEEVKAKFEKQKEEENASV